ncbi:hypothetical protein BJX76DRAFT_368837 [Aspergillus varians]
MAISRMRAHRRSTSMPLSPSYASLICAIDSQNRNGPQSSVGPRDTDFETKAAVKGLFHSLRARHIDISSMVFERFKLAFQNMQTTTKRRVLEQFLRQPMQILNADLSQILRIQNVFSGESLAATTNIDRAHRFYVRSWVFTPAQLLLVVRLLRTRGFCSARLDEWEFQCCITPFGSLTVRYIGMIKGRRDFIQRSQLDISEKSPNSLFGAFRDIIHEFPQLAVSMLGPKDSVGSQYVADDTERLLIQFFGEKSLLNVHTDEELFRSFNSRYFEKFSNTCVHFPEADWRKLLDGFDEIERHARTYTMKREAKPYQYKRNTIMVFLGEELSQQHLKAGHTFFQGSASVSVFIRRLISRLNNIETDQDNAGRALVGIRKTYTFINALPLPGFSNVQRALQILKNYMQCVKPIIVVTYGHRAHGDIASGFQKLRIQECGLPPLSKKTVRISICSVGVSKGDVTIHISLSHPGKYQYGKRDCRNLRHFYIQKQLVYLVAYCAMEAIDQRMGTPFQSSRGGLSTGFLDRVSRILNGLSIIALKITDDGIQREEEGIASPEPERSLLKRKAEALEKEFTCPIFGYSTFDYIFSLGRAQGSQNSPERATQLEQLWAKNITELHLIIPNGEGMRGRWMEELSRLSQGQSYFLKTLNSIPQPEYFKALARVCNPAGRHKKRYDGITEATELRSGLWVARQEIQAYRTELSPRIKPNGEIKIKWLTSGGAKRTLTMESPRCAIPQTGVQSRALSFTEHGIDIPWEKEPPTATLPRWMFKSKNGQLLQELWRAVRSELGHKTPRQNRPPRVHDANFLLYNFLNERFPNGDVTSTEDLREFVNAKWLDMLDRPHPFIAILAPNIRAYRSCKTQKTYPYTVFYVGPPS